MKFTDKSIQTLRPKSDRYEAWEDNGKGFGIRVSSTGLKSWIFFYRFDGMNRRMTLGRYPAMTLAEAHTAHAKAKEHLVKGIDPGDELTKAREDHRGSPTVVQLANEYIEKWAKPRKRSWQEDQRMLAKDVIPLWKRKKAKDIRRRDVILLIDEIVDRGAPISANRTLRIIKQMFSFAVSRGILNASPCVEIKAPAKENQRDRVLNEKEIKIFWTKLDEANMAEGTRLALKFQLVVAQRKGEIALAQPQEFDLKKGWWVIPAEKCKNGMSHRVPLAKLAVSLIKKAKELSPNSSLLFPSPRGEKPITTRSISRAISNNREGFGIPDFTPHDLRRTASSMMTSIGVKREIVGKILNHIESGATKIYDRYSYDKEKRNALEIWANHLEKIITKKKLFKGLSATSNQ